MWTKREDPLRFLSMTTRGEPLTWRLQHGVDKGYTHRLLEDARTSCIASCVAHFPGGAGYEVQRRRLEGPLDGFELQVRRGTFRAKISLQCYARSASQPGALTLRLVATTHDSRALMARPEAPRGYRLARWSASLGALSTAGIAVVAASVAGGDLSAWAASLLLIPMLFATRVCIAAWADSILRDQQRRLSSANTRKALPATGKAMLRDLARWAQVRSELVELQQALAHRLELRPFRGLGAAQPVGPSSTQSNVVLRPGLSPT